MIIDLVGCILFIFVIAIAYYIMNLRINIDEEYIIKNPRNQKQYNTDSSLASYMNDRVNNFFK